MAVTQTRRSLNGGARLEYLKPHSKKPLQLGTVIAIRRVQDAADHDDGIGRTSELNA